MVMHKLHINMSKCCFIHFKSKSKLPVDNASEHYLKLNNTEIKQVTHTLITIDYNLSWDEHILDLKRKLNYATSLLNKMRDCLPAYLLPELYHSLSESHLTYCITVWGGAKETKINSLWIAQKDAYEICLETRRHTLINSVLV